MIKKAKILGGVLALAAAASASPMRFTQAGTYIVAQGDITSETPAEFKRLSVTPGMDLYFDSPGGNLIAGLELGRLIRAAGLHTYVAPQGGGCYSSCVYAFIGGVVRTYDGHAPLGVHQFHGGSGEASAQTALALLAAYLDEMGVDHRLLEVASLVPAEKIETIPVKTAQWWRLDNSREPVKQAATDPVASLFHLRSECTALGERMLRAEVVNSLRLTGTSSYDSQSGHCYVEIDRSSSPEYGAYLRVLYDAQSGRPLAGTSQIGLIHGESGFIADVMESGMVQPETVGERMVTGHAAYLRAREFIESRMKGGDR